MLGTALQNSSCEGDAYAERLYIVQSTLDSHSSFLLNPLTGLPQQARFLGNLVNCNRKFYIVISLCSFSKLHLKPCPVFWSEICENVELC